MTGPLVDVGIAVHDPRRPVDRAVRSVLDGTRAPVRVTVVAHNTDPKAVAERLGELIVDARVRTLVLDDGIRSPAGPFNAALDAADAPFTSVMGSDDTLESGAIDSWLALAASRSSDVVVARLRHAGGAAVPTPPTRPGRTRGLDPVRDRLSYRSAPLGLVRRERFPTLRFAEGVPVGEDVSYVTDLWFSGAEIDYDRSGPAYLIHSDATERTTYSDRPVVQELAFLHRLFTQDDLLNRDLRARRAVAVKVTRIHVFGVIANRPDDVWWTAEQRESLAETVRMIRRGAPGFERVLSRFDRAVIDAIEDLGVGMSELRARAERRRNRLHPGALIPRDPAALLMREGPLRMSAASWLQTRG